MPVPDDFAWFTKGAYVDNNQPHVLYQTDRRSHKRAPLTVDQVVPKPFGNLAINPENYLTSIPNVGVVPSAMALRPAFSPWLASIDHLWF